MTPTILRAALFAALLPAAALAQQGIPGAHFVENWDMDGDGQVTLAEVAEKRGELFTMFDQDENGALDSAEYDLFDETREADMQTNAGGYAKGPMLGVNQGLMRDFNDANADGSVSHAEFLARIPEWFAVMDSNADGVVNTDDFRPRG